jgi:hypothetical protein
MLGLSVVTGLPIMKKRMEEIDKQRNEFMTKQQRMDDIISSLTSLVSKLMADILTVKIDMNNMSDKLEQKINQIIAILATTHTTVSASPPIKVSRATNNPPRETYITFRWSSDTVEATDATSLARPTLIWRHDKFS